MTKTARSASYDEVLAFAVTVLRARPESIDADTVLDAQADLFLHARVKGYEDEFDPELDFHANDEQREQAAQLAEELDKLHSVLWNRR